MPQLGIVISSVREGRAGLAIAEWFIQRARAHGGFDPTLIDLKKVGLPLLEEPHHPRLQKYTQDTTKAWSATVKGLDAFVFVTAEYNYSTPPALLNALDHLYVEWNYKAAGFVSYGGISGGLRSVQMLKQTVAALKMVPIVEAVALSFFTQQVDKESGAFTGTDAHEKAASVMLDELLRWNSALATLRG